MIRGEGIGLRVPGARRPGAVARDVPRPRADAVRDARSFVKLPETIDELDERIAEAAASFEAGEPTTLTIVEGDDARFVGNIGWRRDAPAPLRICEIGYSVHPDARGRGVARRAIRVFTRWLTLDDDGPRQARVQLDHSVENIASCRVALAAGFEQRRRTTRLPPAARSHGTRAASGATTSACTGGPSRPEATSSPRHVFISHSSQGHRRVTARGHGGPMRIALVTEQFAPEHRTRLPTSPGRCCPA